ncbi:hypothetical protein EQV77_17995 [Halobacillus fulvus]|nr:hypothetical protein EQV77_17995 [Halobacillus fulvus]
MGAERLKKQQFEAINHWTDVFFGKGKHVGYVRVTDIINHSFSRSYGMNDIDRLIEDTQNRLNRYITLNAFTFKSRKTADLKQIRNIGIDIDQYKHGLSIEEGIDHIQSLVADNQIPEPNMVLTSRGIQLFYTLEDGASPKMEWLARFITSQFVGKMKEIGADPNATDMSRLLRVPDSVNGRNMSVVGWEIWNDEPYTLDMLQSFCKPLERTKYNGKKRRNKVTRFTPKVKSKITYFYQTNHVRIKDLEKLLDIRNGDMTGKRNTFFYIYAYHQTLLSNSFSDLLYFMQEIREKVHSRDRSRFTDAEFKRTVKSAYEDATAFYESFKRNGYRVVYKPADGIKKPYKKQSLIDKLEITVEEQRQLLRLHDSRVAKEKDKERKSEERRKKGVRPMDEYNTKRKQQQEDKLTNLKKLLVDNPDMKKAEIADEIGISRQQVYRLLKQI